MANLDIAGLRLLEAKSCSRRLLRLRQRNVFQLEPIPNDNASGSFRMPYLCLAGIHFNRQVSSDMSGMRKPYKNQQDVFDLKDFVSLEPFQQFSAWFEEAKTCPGIMEANSMALATATRDGRPSVRMVLMKGMSKDGIDFYTNYLSRKSQELEENPSASLLFWWSGQNVQSRQIENPLCNLMFYWEPLMKSVRIEGKVHKLSKEQSEEYFHSRPRSSQIGACVSQKQSSAVPSREVLDKRNEELHAMYRDESTPIPKPDYWGGFRVIPHRFEFWQGQSNRIHDRIVFRKPEEGETIDLTVTFQGQEGWLYERLQP